MTVSYYIDDYAGSRLVRANAGSINVFVPYNKNREAAGDHAASREG